MKRCLAFTLIELLVVVTIIVVLLALLTPAMDKAITSAERAVCASNLHAHGTAHSQYGTESRGKLLTIPRHYKGAGQGAGDGLAYPWIIWLYAETFPKEISLEAMRPYLGQAHPPTIAQTTMPKVWTCPSSRMTQLRTDNENAYLKQPRGFVYGAQDEGPGFLSEYAYFGGGGGTVPAKYATNRNRINNGKVGGKGILMGDNIFRHSNRTWYYTHGEYIAVPNSPPPVEGMNALTGDGAAGWDSWDDTRRSAAYGGVGPKDEMGDYISAIGEADEPNFVVGDLPTFY